MEPAVRTRHEQLELILFDPASYGALTGRLFSASFYVSAATPLLFTLKIERYGAGAALVLALALSICALIGAMIL